MAEDKNNTTPANQEPKSLFERLAAVDCNDHTEKKGREGYQLTYLTWSWAWDLAMRNTGGKIKWRYGFVKYEGEHEIRYPYILDPKLGYLVSTEVTIDGETLGMQLPVMDSNNYAMKDQPYTIVTGSGERQKKHDIAAATMFDINTAIMRCLAKNLALFGLGLYIYSGEDLPLDENGKKKTEPTYKRLGLDAWTENIVDAKTADKFTAIYQKNPKELDEKGLANFWRQIATKAQYLGLTFDDKTGWNINNQPQNA